MMPYKDPEKRKAYHKAYRAQWYQDNKEHYEEVNKLWIKEHRAEFTIYQKEWSSQHRARRNEAKKIWREEFPLKNKAHRAVWKETKKNPNFRQPCEICGVIETEGHHYLGYAEEHWLDVKWLCKKHHVEAHLLSKK